MNLWFNLLYTGFIIYDIVQQVSSLVLTSTLNDERLVCDGDTVTFTCTVRETNILGWSSNEYIGPGLDRLDILSICEPGTPHLAQGNMNTSAKLINAFDDNGVTVIESELRIEVQSDIVSSSVTCHNVGTDKTITIHFRRSGTSIATRD